MTDEQAQRERAARGLAVAFALLQRARETYDGSEESRAMLREAQDALDAAELLALAVTLGTPLDAAS